MPSLRRVSRLAVVPLLLVAALVSPASRGGAQPLPGSQPADARGSFTRLVRAGVDSTLARWSAAAAARDTGTLARLYATTAAIYPTYGDPIHGRRAIGDALAQALPRVTRARFSIERLDASGDLASVIADLTYDVALASGGSYERRERVQLTMKPQWNAGWQIETQSGGDLAPRIAWAAAPRTTLAAGQTDTVTVRVTDALGGGIRDVLVSFATDREAATVVPAVVRTNARGEAVAIRTARGVGGGELRATAAVAPEDALVAAFTTAP